MFNTVGHTQNNRKFAKLIDFNFVETNEVVEFLAMRGNHEIASCKFRSGIDGSGI